MKKNHQKKHFLYHIQNRQFIRLFFKNWLLVFFSIMLPLGCCTIAIQYYSNKGLLQEIDASVQRSMSNTKATLEMLLGEAKDVLEKQRIDQDISDFMDAERGNPAGYGFSEKVNKVLERIEKDKRESLYYSLDAYAAASDFLASTLYQGQLSRYLEDQSLVKDFEAYRKIYPKELFFAVLRTSDYVGKKTNVLTVYYVVGTVGEKTSFISLSINIEKLIDYITDNTDAKQGAYLITDKENRVILDTSGVLLDTEFMLPEQNVENVPVTKEIYGQDMMISCADMDFWGWHCVQVIPIEQYHYNSNRLKETISLIMLIGALLSLLLSYATSRKLFRPVDAILRILEDPTDSENIEQQNGEIQYLLMRILELFQRNISLEKEMLNRVFALRRAKAKALQEQMTPHFINNVLQTINWIAIEETGEENSVTSQSIILLADILETGKNQKYCLTTVEKEVEYTRKFLELEKLRYGNGIICHYEIDEAVRDMAIPGISLQTLVENSISHGFRTRCGCGEIYVSIRKTEEDGLDIIVEDDGTGIEPNVIKRIFKQLNEDDIYVGEHLGLINFFQRFLLIYGENCQFHIGASCYGGTAVEIRTPQISEEMGMLLF